MNTSLETEPVGNIPVVCVAYVTTYDYVPVLAVALRQSQKTWTGTRLANHLNDLGLTTLDGNAYGAGRPIYNTLGALYRHLERLGRHAEATAVAEAFTLDGGEYAYDA